MAHSSFHQASKVLREVDLSRPESIVKASDTTVTPRARIIPGRLTFLTLQGAVTVDMRIEKFLPLTRRTAASTTTALQPSPYAEFDKDVWFELKKRVKRQKDHRE